MPLSPEEKQKIYEEEKERIRIQKQLKSKSPSCGTLGCLFIILFIGYIFSSSIIPHMVSHPTSETKKQKTQDSSSVPIGKMVQLKGGYPIAISKEMFDKAFEMLVAKDFDAYNKLEATGLVGLTKEGVEVYVVDMHPFSGTAEVRLKGETDVLWTNVEAVQPEDMNKETNKPTKIPKPAITQKTSVYEGIGITYGQVMAYLSDFFPMEKSTPVNGEDRYMGQTVNKCALIEIIGNKSNILQATISVAIPSDRQDIVSENSAFILCFLKNIEPEWEGREKWATNSLNKLSETSQSQEIIIGNKKVSMSLYKELGMVLVTVKKAVNDGTVKDTEVFNAEVTNPETGKGQTNDRVVLKNGQIIEGQITEETDEFITVRESIGTEGFIETKYNKSEIDKVGKDTDTEPIDTRKYK